MFIRPKYIDISMEQASRLDSTKYVAELKEDGIWAFGHLLDGEMRITCDYDGVTKGTISGLPEFISATLVGEYMYGSNWSIRHKQSGIFKVFDILIYQDKQFYNLPYSFRKRMLANVVEMLDNPRVVYVGSYLPMNWDYIWKHQVVENDYEGLVFKNVDEDFINATWYRAKRSFTMDYVCMGMTEGGGRNAGKMGAIKGGLYINGELRFICQIGGGFTDQMRSDLWNNRDQYIGRVFEAKGWKIFPSGALRHPNFLRWRDDKPAERCVLPIVAGD